MAKVFNSSSILGEELFFMQGMFLWFMQGGGVVFGVAHDFHYLCGKLIGTGL